MPTPHPAVAVLAMRRETKRGVALAYGCSEHYVSRVLLGHTPPSAGFRAFLPAYLGLPSAEVWADERGPTIEAAAS